MTLAHWISLFMKQSKESWWRLLNGTVKTIFVTFTSSEFLKSAPVTSSSCRLYNNHVKDTQDHGQSCHLWPQSADNPYLDLDYSGYRKSFIIVHNYYNCIVFRPPNLSHLFQGSLIVQVQAVDGDAGVGNAVSYEIISGKCDSVYSRTSLRLSAVAFVERLQL